MNEKSTRQKFTKKFKEDAIKTVLEPRYSNSETGRRLGIHPSNITRWIRGFRRDQEDIAGGVIKNER
jgi:transposase-like protein